MFEWILENLNGTALSPVILGLGIWLYRVYSNQQRGDKSIEEIREWIREHEKEVTMALQEFSAYKANQDNLEEKVEDLHQDIKDTLDKINNKLDLLNQKVWSSLGKQ